MDWCFQTVMLENTLESPLESKEIKPVNSKGNQTWIFTARTDAEAEAPILWFEELTHWKRPWCWERLRARGEGGDRGWHGWMASLTPYKQTQGDSGGQRHRDKARQLLLSNSLRPHGLQHTRLPCPSPSPRVCSNSRPLSQWCHPTISSSVIPFSLSQHQSLFQWVSSLPQVAKVVEFQLQYQAFQWIFRNDFL